MTSRNKKTTRRQREDRPRSLIDDGVDAVCRKEEVAGTTHRSQVIGDLTSPAPLRSATQAQGQGRCDVSDFRVTSPLDVNSAPVIQSFSPAPALGARKGAFLDCPAVSSNQESQQVLGRVADPRIDNLDSNQNPQVGLPGEDADAVRRAAIASTRFTRDAIVGAHPQSTDSVGQRYQNITVELKCDEAHTRFDRKCIVRGDVVVVSKLNDNIGGRRHGAQRGAFHEGSNGRPAYSNNNSVITRVNRLNAVHPVNVNHNNILHDNDSIYIDDMIGIDICNGNVCDLGGSVYGGGDNNLLRDRYSAQGDRLSIHSGHSSVAQSLQDQVGDLQSLTAGIARLLINQNATQSPPPRLPRFSGRDWQDPEVFFGKLDRYFRRYDIPSEEWAEIALEQLEGKAEKLFAHWKHLNIRYDDVRARILKEFDSPEKHCALRAKLFGETQKSEPTEIFIAAKEGLFERIAPTTSPRERVVQVTALLRPELRMMLRAVPVSTLAELSNVASEIEGDYANLQAGALGGKAAQSSFVKKEVGQSRNSDQPPRQPKCWTCEGAHHQSQCPLRQPKGTNFQRPSPNTHQKQSDNKTIPRQNPPERVAAQMERKTKDRKSPMSEGRSKQTEPPRKEGRPKQNSSKPQNPSAKAAAKMENRGKGSRNPPSTGWSNRTDSRQKEGQPIQQQVVVDVHSPSQGPAKVGKPYRKKGKGRERSDLDAIEIAESLNF
ncbi:unnamed protein product [Acanthoscelides obtectus]|uniref:Retrotransposon gag domain-containing protein n=1 Tax=Acanthoscelides obtectus TaxID=200917 RepID=A0A9P0VS64_ACAOB|nr:unnamed protein product [Acanthoscelides obtectus]CAK1688196.1 hypothetical protein AOBTE_LOCUS36599 [Acanthoscelides obtectus]